MKERKLYYMSNSIFCAYMISKHVEFDAENIEKGEYNGKVRFSFPFYTDDEHFREARDMIMRAKEEHLVLEFPEFSTDEQLSKQDAFDIYHKVIDEKFPKPEKNRKNDK